MLCRSCFMQPVTPYPNHLAGRTYGLIVHGDVAATGSVRRAFGDWLDWMGMVAAGSQALLDRYIAYYEPYATSHDALDDETALFEEAANVARAITEAISICARVGCRNRERTSRRRDPSSD